VHASPIFKGEGQNQGLHSEVLFKVYGNGSPQAVDDWNGDVLFSTILRDLPVSSLTFLTVLNLVVICSL